MTPKPPGMKTRRPSRLAVNANAWWIGAPATGFYLPCPFKTLTHVDCPGCGFQRSVVALWEGDVATSFLLYPPAIPLLALFVFLGLKWVFKWDRDDRVTRYAGIAVGAMVLISYGAKLLGIWPVPSAQTLRVPSGGKGYENCCMACDGLVHVLLSLLTN